MRRDTGWWGTLAAILGGHAAVWLAFDGLRFPVARDELHFWPTAQRFSHAWLPSLELLRDYGELNTPLAFIVWGWLERSFAGGIAGGRTFNFTVSLLAAALVAGPPQRWSWHTASAVAGLSLFPYYLGTATHLYSDILAGFLALLGVHLHLGGRYLPAAAAFALGIASRQYIVAFPAAIVLYEMVRARGPRVSPAQLAPGAAAATLLGWMAFFGGFGPPGEIERQAIATVAPLTLLPQNGLFFLAIIGIYFVLPERVLFRQPRGRWTWGARDTAAAALLVAAFLAFPPLDNPVVANTLGHTDRAIRLVLPDASRMVLYCALAVLAVTRFLREPLPLALLAVHALMLMKAHVAWEKYALPALLVLWYLKARSPDGRRWAVSAAGCRCHNRLAHPRGRGAIGWRSS